MSNGFWGQLLSLHCSNDYFEYSTLFSSVLLFSSLSRTKLKSGFIVFALLWIRASRPYSDYSACAKTATAAPSLAAMVAAVPDGASRKRRFGLRVGF